MMVGTGCRAFSYTTPFAISTGLQWKAHAGVMGASPSGAATLNVRSASSIEIAIFGTKTSKFGLESVATTRHTKTWCTQKKNNPAPMTRGTWLTCHPIMLMLLTCRRPWSSAALRLAAPHVSFSQDHTHASVRSICISARGARTTLVRQASSAPPPCLSWADARALAAYDAAFAPPSGAGAGDGAGGPSHSSATRRVQAAEKEAAVARELRQRLREAPAGPGVYLFRDGAGRLLYVGKSVNLRARLRSYFITCASAGVAAGAVGDDNAFQTTLPEPARGLGQRQRLMALLVRSVETIVTADAAQALMLEAALIKQRQPPFNVALKDGRSSAYPYLCVTWSQDYPRLFITRYKVQPEGMAATTHPEASPAAAHAEASAAAEAVPSAAADVALLLRREDAFLGPFVDSQKLAATLELVKRALPLRQRWAPLHRHKPCLNYDVGRCPGVCQQLVSGASVLILAKEAH